MSSCCGCPRRVAPSLALSGAAETRGALRLSRISFAASGTCGFVFLFGKLLQSFKFQSELGIFLRCRGFFTFGFLVISLAGLVRLLQGLDLLLQGLVVLKRFLELVLLVRLLHIKVEKNATREIKHQASLASRTRTRPLVPVALQMVRTFEHDLVSFNHGWHKQVSTFTTHQVKERHGIVPQARLKPLFWAECGCCGAEKKLR